MHVRDPRPGLRTPLLIAGAGAAGGAMIAGWRRASAVVPNDLIIRDPNPGPEASAAVSAGARLNPPDADLAVAKLVILAVKPQLWRPAAEGLAPFLAPDAVIVSVVAGIAAAELAKAFSGRSIIRAMPTLAVALGAGAVAFWAPNEDLAREAEALFAPLGSVSRLADEDMMHAATAASGSGPAYLCAFIEALEGAAAGAGLPTAVARRLVRATITGAAALLATGDDEPAELRARVTTPGGTTEAAMGHLLGADGLEPLMRRAVESATARSRELGR